MRRYANHCVDDYCLCRGLHGQAVHIARSSHDPFRLQKETVLKISNPPLQQLLCYGSPAFVGSSVA